MFKLYTERQMERELDKRMSEIYRLEHIEHRIRELDEKLYRLESIMYKPAPTCDTATLEKCNEG